MCIVVTFLIYLFPEQLVTLILSAKEHGIEFIYAISPGLDITFSSRKDVSSLKRKLDQVNKVCAVACSVQKLPVLLNPSHEGYRHGTVIKLFLEASICVSAPGVSLWLHILRPPLR